MSSPRHGSPSDILIVPANADKNASDYIVGDLHGNDGMFKIIDRNRTHASDRLFIAGDLVDRGAGNVDIVRAIVANNADARKGKIYCVRGNHEQLCLDTIEALTRLTEIKLYGMQREELLLVLYVLKRQTKVDAGLKMIFADKHVAFFLEPVFLLAKKLFDKNRNKKGMTRKKYMEGLLGDSHFQKSMDYLYGDLIAYQSTLSLHEINGGKWLLDLYLQELNTFMISAGNDEKLVFANNSNIAMIHDYMHSLPFIIHVQGEHPFNVVHADMPIGVNKLLQRAKEGKGLSESEREYALWARQLADAEIRIKKVHGCREYSVPTLVGHTIDGGVRVETNTMDLDVATYVRDCALVVQMPAGKVFMLSDGEAVKSPDKDVLRIANNVQLQLERQSDLKCRRERHHEKKLQRTQRERLFKGRPPVNDSESAEKAVGKKTLRNRD